MLGAPVSKALLEGGAALPDLPKGSRVLILPDLWLDTPGTP